MMMRLGWCQNCGITLKTNDTFNNVRCEITGNNELLCSSCLGLLYEYDPNGHCTVRSDQINW